MPIFPRMLSLALIPLLVGCTPARTDSTLPLGKNFDVKATQAAVHVRIDESLLPISPAIHRWISDGVTAVETYYDRFPVTKLQIQVFEATSAGVHGGASFGYPSPYVRLNVGSNTTSEQFRRDWMLTHELIHLSFPTMRDEHVWAQEGLATYVEPLARQRAGQLSAEKVWMDLVEGLPHGVRELRRAGLDENGSWGCTYWGGAVFWLLADIEIRKRSSNKFGLQHALKAILAEGGHNGTAWPLRKALEIGDRGLDTPVLVDLYERMRAGPQAIDLNQLWSILGIGVSGGRPVFDDSAPLAPIRKAIAR